MKWTIGGIVGTLVVGFMFAMFGGSVASGFNAAAWVFTIYMAAKLTLWIPSQIPELRIFKPPVFSGEPPSVIERDRLPVFSKPLNLADHEGDGEGAAAKNPPADVEIYRLVEAFVSKVANAADEASLVGFLNLSMTNMRRSISGRYSGINGEINTLAFEGAIGTILGMMTFLAQSVVLFKLPVINSADFDAVEFAQVIVGNLDKINLYTVMTAFITSLIGWGAKGWLGKYVDDRRGVEMDSLTQVETWIVNQIIARLHLPSQVSTYLTLQATSDLAKPLVAALEAMRVEAEGLRSAVADQAGLAKTIADELAPIIQGLTLSLGAAGGATFQMRMVEGGYTVVFNPRLAEKAR